jgi:hypothetical protein
MVVLPTTFTARASYAAPAVVAVAGLAAEATTL